MGKARTVYSRQWIVPLVLMLFLIFWWSVIRYRLYFNVLSSSMPRGIYIRVDEKPKAGSTAATCLTDELAWYGLERGYLVKGRCPTGIQPVLKKVYAGYNDTVSMQNGRLTLNGLELTDIDILETDSQGREVALFYEREQLLEQDEFWLMSDHKKNSWDSRYWGPVKIVYSLKPVWTFDE